MADDDIGALKAEIAALSEQLTQLASAVYLIAGENGGEVSEGISDDHDMFQDVVPVLGGGGGKSYGAFRIKDGKIVDKFYMVSRGVYSVSGEYNATAGTWSLVVPHNSFGNAYLTTQGGITDDVQTVIPLYTLNDSGEIVQDYRGMPFVMLRE